MSNGAASGKPRFLSLYSGVGLHDLGLTRAGIEIVGQVEWDSYCSAVLDKHWPGLPRWADVRTVSVQSVRESCGRIDGITGGFSCKDVSVAGQGRGIGKETESGITWRNMFRLIRGLRPVWLIIENVPRLRTLAADRVLAALERIGYACWPVVVGAEHLGAPHRRHRVWIVAYAQSSGRQTEGQRRRPQIAGAGSDGATIAVANPSIPRLESGRSLCGGSGAEITVPASCGALTDLAVADGARSAIGVSGANQPRCEGLAEVADNNRGGLRWPSRPGEPQHDWEAPRIFKSSVGSPASRGAGRLAGFTRKSALKSLGNANPPICAEIIGRAVMHLRSKIGGAQ